MSLRNTQLMLPIFGRRASARRIPRDARKMVVDNFAGGGGASLGIEAALGRPVDLSINHDADAIAMHEANHPNSRHLCENLYKVDPVEACGGRPVGLAWFSPDCTHFSRAKGAKPVKKSIRGLAWVVVKWAAKVRPEVIILENVREFRDWGPLTADDMPCPKRKGLTFKRWVGQLRGLGYQVEWRELNAADYGAATNRRRLFLVARCDGRPITWPEPTHGKGRAFPHRAAAEIIDWFLPCPSIFERKRPLADKTLRRIAAGIRKFVIECADPFILRIGQYGSHGDHVRSCAQPISTITSKAEHCLVVPHVSKFYGGVVGTDARDPLGTITAIDHNGLVAATLIQTGYGEREGQQPRVPGITKPLGTVVAGGQKHALVTSWLTKFYGTNIGSDMRRPVPTVTGQGQHVGEVRALLIKFYGQGGQWQKVSDPLHTITSKHRFGLVTVQGERWQIADIGLRMLTPRELARAQGFSDDYILTGSKASQVARIGNSVCPVMAQVLVRANCADLIVSEAA